MKVFPNQSAALIIGLFLLCILIVVSVVFVWYTKPIKRIKELEKRMFDAEVWIGQRLYGEVKSYYMDGMDALEDELNHLKRRYKGKKNRKQ